MDKPLLSYNIWLQLNNEQKRKMVRLFGIARTGESVVHVGVMIGGNISGEAKQDGHRPEDLYAITNERMVELLNLETEEGTAHNFYELYQAVIDSLDDIYYDQYPDEKPLGASQLEERVAKMQEAAIVSHEKEAAEAFVPRDPEELIKHPEEMPKTDEAIESLDVDSPELLAEDKSKNNAKTKTTTKTKTK